jgi:hypothetical protein
MRVLATYAGCGMFSDVQLFIPDVDKEKHYAYT